MQSTTTFLASTLVTAMFLVGCSSSTTTSQKVTSGMPNTSAGQSAEQPISIAPLGRLGQGINTMTAQGTLSVTGKQSMPALTFSSILAGNDSCRLTVNGPMGITAARIWCTQTKYRAVNYFNREVYEGNVTNGMIASGMPFPIDVNQIFPLMRGTVPGTLARFTSATPHKENHVLYTARNPNSGVTEYALVDTTNNRLVQFQRKNNEGVTEIDVRYENIRTVSGFDMAHMIGIGIDNKASTATFTYETVTINEPIKERLMVDAPSGFKKVTN